MARGRGRGAARRPSSELSLALTALLSKGRPPREKPGSSPPRRLAPRPGARGRSPASPRRLGPASKPGRQGPAGRLAAQQVGAAPAARRGRGPLAAARALQAAARARGLLGLAAAERASREGKRPGGRGWLSASAAEPRAQPAPPAPGPPPGAAGERGAGAPLRPEGGRGSSKPAAASLKERPAPLLGSRPATRLASSSSKGVERCPFARARRAKMLFFLLVCGHPAVVIPVLAFCDTKKPENTPMRTRCTSVCARSQETCCVEPGTSRRILRGSWYSLADTQTKGSARRDTRSVAPMSHHVETY